ncbi:hypothetical protein T492DRAFT_911966 [Pavlovales sp. CCMP2436]|nr:hypothetical protein T492DRAFT_911966 [Pavlovales sp. CCMP2436]
MLDASRRLEAGQAAAESEDLDDAEALFRRGHAGAQRHYTQCMLGTCYGLGKGVLFDDDESDNQAAARYFRLAARQGHGKGVLQTDKEAARWNRLAADQSSVDAQFQLGILLRSGDGVPQDLAEAARYFRLAADQGDAFSQYHLGNAYLEGLGVLTNPAEAARLFRFAADRQLPAAQPALGRMLCAGYADVPADKRAGTRLVAQPAQRAAEEGTEAVRSQALELLRSFADEPEVVAACCIGCGAHHRRTMKCSKCHTARFCSSECIKRMWPTHRPSCQRWQREQVAEAVQAAADFPSD